MDRITDRWPLVLVVLASATLLLLLLIAWARRTWARVRPRWKRTWLYVLVSWRPVYVGISNRPDLRQQQHLAGQDRGRLGEYIRRGNRPRMVTLCSGPRWLIAGLERLLIALFGWCLLNDLDNPWR